MTKEELAKFRHKLGLTQEKMGRLMGMSVHNYNKIEKEYRGRKITKQHQAMLKTIEFIHDRGLLDELL
ncbi:MAG: hypothetical protein GY820_39060 [Gammaproteobacteria bacterium]|nr:hypothetical protein [Gammaproteobacteria bacterium]